MKKVHEFTGIWAWLCVASFVLMVGGMGWCLYGFVQTWDLLLTRKELFLYSWKGVVTMLVGYFLFQFCLTKSK